VVALLVVAVQTVVVEEVAGFLVDEATILQETILEDKALPNRSARFVTNLITPLLSVGTGLKRTSSPTITRMQDIQQPMVLTLIGMLIVGLPTTLQVSSRS
jgi:hypothetical protein